MWGTESVVDGVSFRESAPSGPERDAEFELYLESLRARASTLDESAASLRDLVARYEPVQFVSALVGPASVGFAQTGSLLDDGAETHTWAAKVEYLLGLALSVPPGTRDTPMKVVDRAVALLGDIFDAAHAGRMVRALQRPLGDNASLDSAVFLLEQEHLTDRMPGYPVHLEQVDAEVFDRHRDFYVATIGFNPADVTRVVRRRVAATNARLTSARPTLRRRLPDNDQRSIDAITAVVNAINEARVWEPDATAADSGVAASEVSAMLDFFSTTFGSQPDFRLPGDDNQARSRPLVTLEDGNYFVADPWSVPAVVHTRLVEGLDGRARERYFGHREKGHQRIVGNALRRVFGVTHVAENQHYDGSRQHGEVDVLVAGEWPLIVEAKAHSLTLPGRRGAPQRVSHVASNVIKTALEQTARARQYIVCEHGRSFADADGVSGVELLPSNLIGVEEIVVTFERMDPLALQGADLVGEPGRRPWTICATDLLMVVDLLGDPASFHHYARTRRMARELGIMIYVESDALGGYFIDRLSSQIQAALHRQDTTVSLGYTSWAINDHFNRVELGLRPDGPVDMAPRPILEALAVTFGGDTRGAWTTAADAVMSTTPDVWRRWRHFSRRHRAEGSSFALSEEVAISVGTTALDIQPNGVVRLCVPSDRRGDSRLRASS